MKTLHVVTHTHWDREWYRTYEEFRVFLVRLLDELLVFLDSDPAYTAFMLDGQTVQLEDYLEVNPDQEEAIRRQVQAGRLLIGPMYIQPDEYIPSGESLVRNFLIGKQIADRFGGWMNLGYFPDSFGQASQIPQILRGFGIDTVVFWRGLCDENSSQTELIWRSREGSEVLVEWMPFSYGNAHTLSSDPQKAAVFFRQAVDLPGPKPTTDHVLLMKGWDHSSFTPWITETIRNAVPLLESTFEVRHSTLPLFIEAVRGALPSNLQVLEGEFRNAKTMRIHPGIGATRMDIKQKNRRMEKLLENAVEPVCVLAAAGGESYPAEMIRMAWKYMLQSQAHDSLCCCCTDQALKAVADRYRRADEIGSTLLVQASHALARQVETNTQSGQPIVVINPLMLERQDLIEAQVLTRLDTFRLCDEQGNPVPYQILESKPVRMGFDPSVAAMSGQKTDDDLLEAVGQRPDNPEIYYDQSGYVPISDEAEGIRMNRVRLCFPAREATGAGWQTCYLQEGEPYPASAKGVSLQDMVLENEHLRVTLQGNGSFDVLDKQQNQSYQGLHVFEDSGDAGDSYNYSPPVNDLYFSSRGETAVVNTLATGPLWAGWKVTLEMSVPDGLSTDGKSRAGIRKPLQITSRISLAAGERFVRIKTEVTNQSCDHRLRVLFPTGVQTGKSFAEEQFGVIERPNRRVEMDIWEEEGWVEAPLAIYPHQTFVDLNNGSKGLAVLNRDLTEYEVLEGEQDTLALTLLRCVGAMGRPDLVIRPGRASGLTVPTPDSNLLTTLTFEYAVYPHAGDYRTVGHQAAQFTTPCQVVQSNRHDGERPGREVLFSLEPQCLVPSCLKQAEWRDGIIVRLYNAGPQPIEAGVFRCPPEYGDVFLVNLKEENLEEKALERVTDGWKLPAVKASQLLTLFISSPGKG
ncbi:MAG: hypothetical protein JXA25_06895 [Anaerolineales bacterium]|nr:hypothetical protein [Anaerolineales bacterium]